MFGGEGAVDGVFEVVAGGRGAQHHVGDVLLLLGLQRIDHLGGAADADQQDAGGERIERAAVTDFPRVQDAAQLRNHVMRRKSRLFPYVQNSVYHVVLSPSFSQENRAWIYFLRPAVSCLCFFLCRLFFLFCKKLFFDIQSQIVDYIIRRT